MAVSSQGFLFASYIYPGLGAGKPHTQKCQGAQTRKAFPLLPKDQEIDSLATQKRF